MALRELDFFSFLDFIISERNEGKRGEVDFDLFHGPVSLFFLLLFKEPKTETGVCFLFLTQLLLLLLN